MAVEDKLMRIFEKLLMGLALTGLLFSLASCCCAGGSDSDNNDDTDIVNPGDHNEGAGGDV